MTARLSKKAQETVEWITAEISVSIRKTASQLASDNRREFADEDDAREAFRQVALEIAGRFQKSETKVVTCNACGEDWVVSNFHSLTPFCVHCSGCLKCCKCVHQEG